MSSLTISSPTTQFAVDISADAEAQAGVANNPSGRQSVLRLKLIAAAFLTECAKAPQGAPGGSRSGQPGAPGLVVSGAIPVNPATGQPWAAPFPVNPATGREWSAAEVNPSTNSPYPFPDSTGRGPSSYPGQSNQTGQSGYPNQDQGRDQGRGYPGQPGQGQYSDQGQGRQGQGQYGDRGQWGGHGHGHHQNQGQNQSAAEAMLAALAVAVAAAEAAPSDY
jgi:hypothetical protein